MSFLADPISSLFSRDFYRKASRWSVLRGLAYLCYLSLLLTLLFVWLLKTVAVPEMDQFVGWLKKEMPVLVWSEGKLALKEGTVRELKHPVYGPLIKFDMTHSDFTELELGEYTIGITPEKAFVHQGGGRLKEFAWKPRPGEEKQTFEITQDTIGAAYHQMKSRLTVFFIFLLWGAVILWNVIAALFYSWVSLMINWTRRGEKLHYSHLLNISICALTPATFVMASQLCVPALNRLSFGIFGSFVLTAAYLFFAILGTDDPPLPKAPFA